MHCINPQQSNIIYKWYSIYTAKTLPYDATTYGINESKIYAISCHEWLQHLLFHLHGGEDPSEIDLQSTHLLFHLRGGEDPSEIDLQFQLIDLAVPPPPENHVVDLTEKATFSSSSRTQQEQKVHTL